MGTEKKKAGGKSLRLFGCCYAPARTASSASRARANWPDVDAVHEPVVHLQGKVQHQPPIPGNVLAPADPGHGVVHVQVSLVGHGRQLHPGKAGEVNKVLGLRGLVQKCGLGGAFRLGPAAEVKKIVSTIYGHNVEKLRARMQVREAGNAPIQQKKLTACRIVAECLHRVHGFCGKVHHGAVKGAPGAAAPVHQLRYIHGKGDCVKGVGHGGEKVEDGLAGPVLPGDVPLLHGDASFRIYGQYTARAPWEQEKSRP